MKVEGSPGSSDREMVEFRTQTGGSEQFKKQDHNPGLKENRFWLFKYVLARVLQDETLEGRETQEHWLILKDHLL